LEENTIIGGLGSALCEMVVDNNVTAKMKRFALQDKQEFEFGSRQWLINNGGLEKEKIIKTIKEIKGDL
jgi:transketolase C-terminal domain/subunit